VLGSQLAGRAAGGAIGVAVGEQAQGERIRELAASLAHRVDATKLGAGGVEGAGRQVEAVDPMPLDAGKCRPEAGAAAGVDLLGVAAAIAAGRQAGDLERRLHLACDQVDHATNRVGSVQR
jgi:hypothetical protein